MKKFNLQVSVSIVNNGISEIISNFSNFQEKVYDTGNFKNEYKNLVNELIDYCYENEERHYDEFEENEKPCEHIFLKIKKLKDLNDSL